MADRYESMTQDELIRTLRGRDTSAGHAGKNPESPQDSIQVGSEHLKLAHAAGGVGIWEYRFDTDELRWSEEKSCMFGLATHPTSVSYETWTRFVHPDDRARILETLSDRQPERLDIQYRIVRPDGEVRWMTSRGTMVRDSAGLRMIGVTIDITESKHVEQRLEELNRTLVQRTREAEERTRQLRALAGELARTENRERRRLALLLHDHLQQLLIALRMKVALVRQQPRGDRAGKLLVQSLELLDEAITASRSLSLELSPPMLYDSGLPAALDWLARQMEEKYGLHVEVQGAQGPEDYDIRVFLFQCVRELLFNVVKHAKSPQAQVIMQRADEGRVSITVRDAGAGFDPSTIPRSRESFGLLSIRERLDWLGGRFELRSRPGEGTEATLVAPISRPETNGLFSGKPEIHRPGEGVAAASDRSHIRVLLVDDHSIVREGLTHLLESEEDLEVVAQAADGQTAVEVARTVPVDVVVMDFSMPKMNGADATRRIHELDPGIPVIGMSVYEEQSIADSMQEAGAAAFFRKDDSSDRLVCMIRSLARRLDHHV